MRDLNEGIFPGDIKKLNIDEMEYLCDRIREKLISSVSETGGHLASNLGIVELTVAIHYVFDAPEDRIVWDVGHQSYVHKMLTGRAGRFDSLRRLDGLSGFPKRKESIYDTFDTGHSSNSISAALGMAAARDLRGEDYAVAAVIGDGAMTGGMAYEALNNAGVMDSSLIVILNDNEMSISRNHGSIPQHLGKLRTSEKYTSFKSNLKNALMHIPGVGGAICSGLESVKDAVKYMVVPGIIFEELGFTYIGPVDGHDIQETIDALRLARSTKKPVIVHCITQKGKGYRPAEQHPELFHGVSPFDPKTGLTKAVKTGRSWSDVFGAKLTSMAAADKRIVAISAAMVAGTGLNDFAGKYPDRIYDVGIAEEHAVTFAAGLAASGMRPVVAIYSTFMQRAYDQMLIDVCMQELPVVFCLDRAGIVGADGETHHGIFDLSYLQHMPGMTVLAPADASELEHMMEYAISLERPCAIRYPRGTAEETITENTNKSNTGEKWIPKPHVIRSGHDITIAAAGKMTAVCLRAAAILSDEGISCEVINAGIICPLTPDDCDVYRRSAQRTGRILAAEDNVISGGYGSLIEELFASENIKVYKAGWPVVFVPQGSQAELEARYRLDAEGIADRVRKIIEGTT